MALNPARSINATVAAAPAELRIGIVFLSIVEPSACCKCLKYALRQGARVSPPGDSGFARGAPAATNTIEVRLRAEYPVRNHLSHGRMRAGRARYSLQKSS